MGERKRRSHCNWRKTEKERENGRKKNIPEMPSLGQTLSRNFQILSLFQLCGKDIPIPICNRETAISLLVFLADRAPPFLSVSLPHMTEVLRMSPSLSNRDNPNKSLFSHYPRQGLFIHEQEIKF